MKAAQFFLLLMAIYLAPHLDKKEGNFFGVVCLLSAIFYIILELA